MLKRNENYLHFLKERTFLLTNCMVFALTVKLQILVHTSGGVLRLIELKVDRPIHWFICSLDSNELPFRHLYDALEKSKKTGPKTATGDLAQQMKVCTTLQVLIIILFIFLPMSNILL